MDNDTCMYCMHAYAHTCKDTHRHYMHIMHITHAYHAYTRTSRTQIHLHVALVPCRMCRIARRYGTADQTTSLLLARGDAPPAGKVPSTRAHARIAGAPVRTYAACHDRGCLLGHHKRKPQASERAARTRALVDRSFIRRRYLPVPAVQPCTPTDPCHCALQAANGTGCNRRCCAS